MSVIGIDLGTTNSCVAVFKLNGVEVIENADGCRTTPSCVAFTEDECIIGQQAKEQLDRNPQNTLFDVKRLIGRSFTDPSVESDCKQWSFDVVPENDKPMMKVEYRGETIKYSAEYISSLILGRMKNIASDHLHDRNVKNAVITVPASFNNNQRQATKDAAKAAGLNVIRMINEPTAAAIAYGWNNNRIIKGKTVLVFDIGGGTFDISIITMKEGVFEVKSTEGNSHLGGNDFDGRMVNHFMAEMKMKHKKDISGDKRAVSRLRKQCEKVKCILSSRPLANVNIDCLFEGIDFSTTITRARFEDLNRDLIESTLEHVKNALTNVAMHRRDIDSIIIVGGSSRIPMIQKSLQDFFDGKELNKSLNPDEAIAYGAAVQGAILSGAIHNFLIKDVTPLSLGTEVTGDLMSVIIERNTSIPVKKTRPYVTSRDNQTSIPVGVYEGEHLIASENALLDKFIVLDIPPAPEGETKFDVTFEIDADGILNVSAVNRGTGKSQKIIVSNYRGRISPGDMNRMTKDAERFRADGVEHQERVAAKNDLEEYAQEMKSKMEKREGTRRIRESDRVNVIKQCNKVIDWLAENESAKKEEYEDRQDELRLIFSLIIGKL